MKVIGLVTTLCFTALLAQAEAAQERLTGAKEIVKEIMAIRPRLRRVQAQAGRLGRPRGGASRRRKRRISDRCFQHGCGDAGHERARHAPVARG